MATGPFRPDARLQLYPLCVLARRPLAGSGSTQDTTLKKSLTHRARGLLVRGMDTPQQSLTRMAHALENAADCFGEIESEYDPDSKYAAIAREWVGRNMVFFWQALADANTEVRRYMDKAKADAGGQP